MKVRSRRFTALVAAALLVGSSALARAKDDVCDLEAPRVVAIGDVHGSYDGLVADLKMAGLVGDDAHWTGGQATLVQVGDFTDRGTQTREVLDFLMRLPGEAQKAGGRAVVLLGNHEVMNMLGDLRYVNPDEYAQFRDARSPQLREEFYKRSLRSAGAAARDSGQKFDEKAFTEQFMKQVPLGFVERTHAFSEEGEYGRWLRTLPVVAKVNGYVFLHGGLTPEVAALGCTEITERVHREVTQDIKKTRADPMASLAASENGPLWYRGLAREDETTLAPAVQKTLDLMKARGIVVGHTVTGTGHIETRFGGRVIMIDTGLSEVYGSHRAVLEIGRDGTLAALYPDGRQPLEAKAAAWRGGSPLPGRAVEAPPATRCASAIFGAAAP
jgi:hypothetical protein